MSLGAENPFRAIALKLASVVLFVIMAALIKAASAEVPAGQAVFFRAAFAMPVIVLWLVLRHELSTGLRARKPMAHVWRGLIGSTAMGLSFAGLGLLPLSEVKAIQYVMPIFVVILAVLLLGEKVRLVRISAVVMGLVGVLIILSPRLSGISDGTGDASQTLGAVLVLCGSFFAAFAQIHVRRMVKTEETAAIVFWFSLTAASLSLVTLPFGWVMPTPQAMAFLVASGLIGGLGQILLTSAYRFADASIIAPFEYASMIVALVIGYVVFDEYPTVTMLGGAALVIAAGVLIILRERQLRLRRGEGRKHVTKYG